jgi:hypothetical protein
LEHKALFRSAICIVAIGLLGFRFATIAPDVVRLPREANREAARAVEEHAPRATPVYALIRHPDGLDFYLDRRAVVLRASQVLHRVCLSDRPVAYVMQPWGFPLVEMPCRNRRGVAFFRFRQYAQGREIDVWIVPPTPRREGAHDT